MAINPHHTAEEISGVKCSVVEKKVNKERVEFLKEIMTCNHFDFYFEPVKGQKEDEEILYNTGITPTDTNILYQIYSRKLKSPWGGTISPQEWKEGKKLEEKEFYWQ